MAPIFASQRFKQSKPILKIEYEFVLIPRLSQAEPVTEFGNIAFFLFLIYAIISITYVLALCIIFFIALVENAKQYLDIDGYKTHLCINVFIRETNKANKILGGLWKQVINIIYQVQTPVAF